MTNIDLRSVAMIVSAWAQSKAAIRSVWFFGSQVKGTATMGSDLDIAIELVYHHPDTALANWMLDSDVWTSELSGQFPIPVDLQLYHGTITPTIIQGINDASVKIYERNG